MNNNTVNPNNPNNPDNPNNTFFNMVKKKNKRVRIAKQQKKPLKNPLKNPNKHQSSLSHKKKHKFIPGKSIKNSSYISTNFPAFFQKNFSIRSIMFFKILYQN